MQSTTAQRQYLLTDRQNELLFSDIWLDAVDETVPVAAPAALFLGGQSGSGKSGLAQYHFKEFADRGGVVLINSDALREYHPDFAQLQRTDAEQASFLVNPDTVIWQQKLVTAAISARRNLLFDGTLGGNPAPILQTMQRLHSEGYSIQISVLAVPAEQSRLGICKRYEDQVALKGTGRWVGMANHDRLYQEIPETLTLLEATQLIDRVQLYARPKGAQPPALQYDNKQINGQWQYPALVSATLDRYRIQWPTYLERINHEAVTQQVRSQLLLRGVGQETINTFLASVKLPDYSVRPAVLTDVQLYFEWANDPFTRQQSFNSTPIPWEQHEAWFARKLTDPDALLLVFETADNVPIGQVRFEKQPNSELIIGVSVDQAFRGRGLAAMLIQEACVVCRKQWGDVPVSAYIKPDNQPSIRAFEKAGFVSPHESRKFGVESVCLTFT